MRYESELSFFLRNVCEVVAIEATSIIRKEYSTVRKFRSIDKYSMYELFYENDTLNGMKCIRRQNLRALGIGERAYLILTHMLAKCGKNLASSS